MNDSIRANRELLGKKKSVRELYKDEIKHRNTPLEKQEVDAVMERVASRQKCMRIDEIKGRMLSLTIVAIVVATMVWVVSNVDFNPKVKKEHFHKDELFNTTYYDQGNGLILKTDHYHSGPLASETFLKDSLKHQNSESYYESGEQFRSALYYYVTLIREVFLFKTGDTIQNFPVVDEKRIVKINLVDKKRRMKIEFIVHDNKILGKSYRESKYWPFERNVKV
jgi:antitoxin component YwqK of YwqJK toxin-antitoxin module